MTVNTGQFLQQSYAQFKANGDKSVSSDAMFVIDGFEQLRLLCKQFPQPTLSPAGEIEIATPMGGTAVQPQQLKIAQQGQVQFYETQRGDMDAFLDSVLLTGAKFNARVYEGTLERYKRGWVIQDCFLVFDNPDRDWENRSQVTMVSGTLNFHYFGEKIAGNF
jgi:hypothetical protein